MKKDEYLPMKIEDFSIPLNGESTDKGEDKKKRFVNGTEWVVCFLVVGGVPMIFVFNGDPAVKRINLGQDYKGVPKYKSMDGNRYTGRGSAYEDIIARSLRKGGHDVEQVAPKKNGPDFIIDGDEVQMKYGASVEEVFNNLFDSKTGEYRYPGQKIMTNEENSERLRDLCRENADRFGENMPAINPFGWENASMEEVDAQFRRGLPSMKNDAMDIVNDSKSIISIIGAMLTVFTMLLSIKACTEYRELSKDPDMADLPTRKKIGRSFSGAFRKGWKKMALVTVAVGGLSFACCLIYRQNRRPELD